MIKMSMVMLLRGFKMEEECNGNCKTCSYTNDCEVKGETEGKVSL